MAIKGKSKSRSAKAVTRGPRPAYVPVKKPLLARRGFWVGIASALGVLLVAGLWYGFAKQASQDREREQQQRMADAADAFQGQLDPILSAVGQPVSPTGFQAFPALQDVIAQLEGEAPDAPADAEAIAATAGDTIEAAKSALDALDGMDETALVQGKDLPPEFVLYVINAKGNFVRAMRLYVQVGELVKAAAEAEGPERAALLARAKGVEAIASEIASRANSELVEVEVQAGTFNPNEVPALPLPSGPTGA